MVAQERRRLSFHKCEDSAREMCVADGRVVVVVVQTWMAPHRPVRVKVLDPATHGPLRAANNLGNVASVVALLQQTEHVLARLFRKHDGAVGGSVAVVARMIRQAGLC